MPSPEQPRPGFTDYRIFTQPVIANVLVEDFMVDAKPHQLNEPGYSSMRQKYFTGNDGTVQVTELFGSIDTGVDHLPLRSLMVEWVLYQDGEPHIGITQYIFDFNEECFKLVEPADRPDSDENKGIIK